MSFTSRLGQILSELENIWPGGPNATIPAQYIQVVPTGYTPGYFTGETGLVLSTPGNMVPGRAFFRLAGSESFSASITPIGSLQGYQFYTGAFRQATVATYDAVARALVFITQKRGT